jgi:N-sulfoglucosamine sulfohydrolase
MIARTQFFLVFALALVAVTVAAADRPNLLLITVDDMSADSVGCFGCELADTSPNIDRLAKQGLRFTHAHVQVGNCMPSRNVMWSGRYPHNNGVEGFYQVPDAKHPHLVDLMKAAGYFTGIFHKVSHSTPYHPYAWDLVVESRSDGTRAHVKDPASYGDAAAQGIAAAKDAGKPFCLVINVADPHKPFYAEGRGGATVPDPHVPTRVFGPEEPPTPGFLFEDKVVSKELSHYYSSVRRADDAVGEILAALDKSGQADNTFIMFLSDHGMPLPFAKTQLYHHSTHTPLIVVWPGVTKRATTNDTHMVSAVDFMPTLLDVIGEKHPDGFDGRSFAPLFKGEARADREWVIKEYNENAGRSRDPMRAVQTKRFLYLFNPWSNGERVFATATNGTSTCRRMAELAKIDEKLAGRYHLYRFRVPEELYDVREDPDCLVNLIDSAEHQQELKRLRQILLDWMVETDDHMLDVFRNREDAEAREAYVLAKEAESKQRGPKKNKPKTPATKRGGKKVSLLFDLLPPATVTAGETVSVKVQHKLPADLGEQLFQVTLKAGNDAQRVHREVVKASGVGELDISFDIPAEVPGKVVSFAAFVGRDFDSCLQHAHTERIPVK